MFNENQSYKKENYTNSKLDNHHYTNCKFHHCDFSQTSFKKVRFIDCQFDNCVLNLPQLDDCRLQECVFKESKITGANFFQCDPFLFSIKLESCLLQYCNFANLPLKEGIFNKSIFTECVFSENQMQETQFCYCDLTGTIFHHCNLQKANFSKAFNYVIDPLTNQIKGATFSLPEALVLLRSFEINLES